MAKLHKRGGFTRLDALAAVVTCLLLVLLVPMLFAKPRERSIRAVCAANLGQIGKTMFLYANDNEGALPKAGGPAAAWGPLLNWAAPVPQAAYGVAGYGNGSHATISSCFYLLVKYYEAPTRLFVCRGDQGTTEFKLSRFVLPYANFTLERAWDFGPASVSYKSCSFAYHLPFCLFPLTTSRDPNLPVAADRNPWLKSPAGDAPVNFAQFVPDLPTFGNGRPEQARLGNSATHGEDGQNVLFLDGRVTFETRSFCGVDNDNIYTTAGLTTGGHPKGAMPTTTIGPQSDSDSLLVHDPDVWGSVGGSPKQ